MQEYIQKYDYKKRHFVLCRICLWSATILGDANNKKNHCPICLTEDICSLPIGRNERYKFTINPKIGLDVEFDVMK